jgi:predicted AAA+ superfamily ATPase
MLTRLLELPDNHSLFLFGARGTGKSTLLKKKFHRKSLWIDLLDPDEEDVFTRHPNELRAQVAGLPDKISHVVIDEIQKIPKLLDVVHKLIEETSKKFIMTGSSARKLKRGSANLLAGRAFVYHLFPFSALELKKHFNLDEALMWGLLPKVTEFKQKKEKFEFLKAYANTYLKEEIWGEQLVRNLTPFRRFLEVAAQANGKIINYSNIAQDVGVDDKTVKEYFLILEDTLIGFFLEPFHHSFRKRLSLKPKFYFFDPGVVRALSRQLSIILQPGTSAYGEAFEHFIILECLKLATYQNKEFRFSYLKTKDDFEIDLVVDRPGQALLFIEIKSNPSVQQKDLHTLLQIAKEKDFENAEFICFSNDVRKKRYGKVTVWPWQKGISHYFGIYTSRE